MLIYRASQVPVGEDQVPHIEFTREIARRFNHVFGRDAGFEEKAEAAIKKLGAKRARLYRQLRTRFLEKGDAEALAAARVLVEEAQNLPLGERERLFGYIEGGGKVVLPEPQALLTEAPEDARARRAEDVEVVRQHDRAARRAREHHARRSSACRPIRRG